MAKTAKKLKDVAVGDRVPAVRVVVRKVETAEGYELSFDDGTTASFDRGTDPALEVES